MAHIQQINISSKIDDFFQKDLTQEEIEILRKKLERFFMRLAKTEINVNFVLKNIK